jgi:hypothetical protein
VSKVMWAPAHFQAMFGCLTVLKWFEVDSMWLWKKGSDPGACGWYAIAVFGNSMLVYGGRSDSSDQLDDIFLLSLEEP